MDAAIELTWTYLQRPPPPDPPRHPTDSQLLLLLRPLPLIRQVQGAALQTHPTPPSPHAAIRRIGFNVMPRVLSSAAWLICSSG
ncbi:hypothetical protein CR919_14455 [Stenotrophomonas sp. LMG 10879]|nr:hypothetical protein CR919_14455 [Stenotrophomonas sp. LMG 10879]